MPDTSDPRATKNNKGGRRPESNHASADPCSLACLMAAATPRRAMRIEAGDRAASASRILILRVTTGVTSLPVQLDVSSVFIRVNLWHPKFMFAAHPP